MRAYLGLMSIILLLSAMSSSSCYFFRKRSVRAPDNDSGVVGESIGARAGGVDPAALADVHATTSAYAPAAVRPDPDVLVRQLLLQYREEGSVVAREIGRVENYRQLLGGANENFSITPQKTYDATSLLAKLKVAQEICEGLVAPNPGRHPGWASILPSSPDNTQENIEFLVQRLVGLPSDRIDSAMTDPLLEILQTSLEDGVVTEQSYIPVCAILVVDAGSLLL